MKKRDIFSGMAYCVVQKQLDVDRVVIQMALSYHPKVQEYVMNE